MFLGSEDNLIHVGYDGVLITAVNVEVVEMGPIREVEITAVVLEFDVTTWSSFPVKREKLVYHRVDFVMEYRLEQ